MTNYFVANVWQEQTVTLSKGAQVVHKEKEKNHSDLVVMRLIHQHPDRSFQTSRLAILHSGWKGIKRSKQSRALFRKCLWTSFFKTLNKYNKIITTNFKQTVMFMFIDGKMCTKKINYYVFGGFQCALITVFKLYKILITTALKFLKCTAFVGFSKHFFSVFIYASF